MSNMTVPARDDNAKALDCRAPRAADDGAPASFDASEEGGRRSPTRQRVAIHEAAHVLVARALNQPIAGATIVASDGLDGCVWPSDRTDPRSAPVKESYRELEELHRTACRLMPRLGENLHDAADWFVGTYESAVHRVAGLEAECLEGLEDGGSGSSAAMDYKLAADRVLTICVSPSSVEHFINFARSEAAAILKTYRPVLRALAAALLKHETMTGEQMDQIIATELARSDQESQKGCRDAWRAVVASAASFTNDLHSRPLVSPSEQRPSDAGSPPGKRGGPAS